MPVKRTLPPAAAPIYVNDILQGFSGLMRGQAEIDDLTASLKEYFQVEHCFLLSSGKAALTVILRALKANFPDRNEVLIPAFTCYSVPSAIIKAGLKVCLCDVNPATLDFDFENLRNTLGHTDRLLAIVSNHLFGLPANIAGIQTLLRDSEVSVIEDAAQAMGSVFEKRFLGTSGDIGFFSLGRGKVFSTVEGGIILTHSDSLAEKIDSIIPEFPVAHKLKHSLYAMALSTFMHPSLFWIPKSIPMLKLGETIYDPEFQIKQFSPFQAGLARNWKKMIALFQQARAKNTLYWEKAINRFSWIQPIYKTNGSMQAYPLVRFPVLVKTALLRDCLLKISEKEGLGIMPSYPGTIDTIDEFKHEFPEGAFPGAKECAIRLVTLPVHGFVSSKDRHQIIKCFEMVQAMHHI